MKAYILYINTVESAEYAAVASASCLQHNVACEMVEGIYNKSYDEIKKETGMEVGREGVDGEQQYWKEYNAALGHIEIWKKIAAGTEPAAVLEHDAVVKENFDHVEVNDMEIVHLGPKVKNIDDYSYPSKSLVYARHDVRRWEGAHAYAMTPKTAQYLLDKIKEENRLLPTEGLVSIRNRYNLKFIAIDPAYVVCVQGDRTSFTDATAEHNFKYFPGFLAGVKDKSDLYPEKDYVFSEDWFTGNIPHWQDIFEKTGKKNGDRLQILEIGAYEGRATTWLIDNMLDHPQSVILACDTFEGSVEHNDDQKKDLIRRFSDNIIISKFPEKVAVRQEDSRTFLPFLVLNNYRFDIIYVDGSHETPDVIADGFHAFMLLNKGGVIIFDDYQWSMDGGKTFPVKDAVNFLESKLNLVKIHDGYQRAYQMVP